MERQDKNERIITVDEGDMTIAAHSLACQDEKEEELQFTLGQLIPAALLYKSDSMTAC